MSFGLSLFCIVIFVVRTNGLPCNLNLSIDISDGKYVGDIIVKDDISFDSNYYFEHNGITRGCVCNVTWCIYKCCPFGREVGSESCQDQTSDVETGLNNMVINNLMIEDFYIIHNNIPCFDSSAPRFIINPGVNSPSDHVLLTENLSWLGEAPDMEDFCIDFFAQENKYGALVCVDTSSGVGYHGTAGMIISMPFLLITFIVYTLIPERNLPAKALMCYVLSLLFAYVFLVTIQLHSSFEPFACATVGLLCYFFFMVSFFWMNSSCIDIWLTFSGIRGLTGSKKRDTRRFLYYSAYAWGIPFLLVCLVIGLSYGTSVDTKSLYHPGIGNGQCWFGSGIPTFLYFYLPIAILLTTNIILFCVTAYKIQMVRNDTAMLRRDDSQRSKMESDKQRFNLYLKLLLAMGINWTMEVISWSLNWKFSNIPDEVWYLTDFCNALYGVFIFFIFVFKRNIWVMLKKRYLTFMGKPHLAHSLGTSTTRTTVSHVTSEA